MFRKHQFIVSFATRLAGLLQLNTFYNSHYNFYFNYPAGSARQLRTEEPALPGGGGAITI